MDYLKASRVTVSEFEIYTKAFEVIRQERDLSLAKQAWFNQSVQATKGIGKNVKSAYKCFDDFYDNKKAFESIFNHEEPKKENKKLSLADKNRLLNKKGG